VQEFAPDTGWQNQENDLFGKRKEAGHYSGLNENKRSKTLKRITVYVAHDQLSFAPQQQC
jgi:hypothetical protein